MGLPRYLNTVYESLKGNTRLTFMAEMMVLYQAENQRWGDIDQMTYSRQKKILKYHIARCYKTRGRTTAAIEGEMYSKIPISWFIEWEKVDGAWTWIYIEAKVNRYFHERALEISMARKEAEYKIIMAKEELDRMRNTEQGRTFKGRLRQIIMERDGYKCVLCGKDANDGVKLEVDHIKAWEDGGRTIYDNGRTVCSECNKGLHWAKKFNEKLKEVSEATA